MQNKIILNRIKGVVRPGQFTAILGPSGSGKTTLLNFIASRLVAPNIQATGDLFVNSQQVNDTSQYSSLIGYVTQEDILNTVLTPREAFTFAAELRLKLPKEVRTARVENMLRDLKLLKCSNTPIGSVFTRGISGGERKRTSIGVELLTNPSLIILDEPTTGLDASTSLSVIELLKELANQGRTIVSTIHQPSSEIFDQFDRLMLLVKGNLIYQGDSKESLQYFQQLGFAIPKFNNPSDYYMKLMNEEGLKIEKMQKNEVIGDNISEEFQHRCDMFVLAYKRSSMYKDLQYQEQSIIQQQSNDYATNSFKQFILLLKVSLINQIRNPFDVKVKLIQYIFFGVITLLIFLNLGEGQVKVQNTNGLMFFLSIIIGFSSVNMTLPIFASQRALFLKERRSKYYSVGSYFWAKSLAELPFQILYPVVLVSIIYFAVQLDSTPISKYLILLLDESLAYWYGSSYGLLLSVIFQRIEIASAIVPIISVPFLSTAGYYTSSNKIPKVFYIFVYLSTFKYGFQAGVTNEYTDNPIDCGGYPCNPLDQLGIDQPLWIPLMLQFVLGLFIRVMSWIALYFISKQKNQKLKPSEGESIEV